MKRTMTLAALSAVLAAAQSADQHAAAILNKALEARNPDVRKQAVKALSTAGSIYADRLEAMLYDADLQVRLAVISALEEKGAAYSLRLALDDRTLEGRFAAAKALYNLNDPLGREAMLRVLEENTKTSSGYLAQGGREMKRTSQSASKSAILATRTTLTLSGIPLADRGFMTAKNAITNRPEPGRATPAILLAGETNPRVTEALRNALTDQNPKTRAAAASAAAIHNNASLRNDLLPLLDDKNANVRMQAAASYLYLSSL
jgi:HEAT repeat protein